MRKPLYLLLLAALLLPAFAQKNDATLPPPETPGPNGPWVVTAAPKGDYKATEVYTVNDVVVHNGDRYLSMADKNQGNEPTPVSSLWLRLPAYKGAVSVASWGTTPSVGGKSSVKLKGKHFKAADSYGCGMTSDLLTGPAPDSPPARDKDGKLLPPAEKATFTYTSGEAFSISNVHVSPAGYVCAGS